MDRMNSKQFVELVKQARSYRRFIEADPISEHAVRALVDVARFVPSGGNRQPLRYRIVIDPEERRGVFSCLRWAGALKDWSGPKEGERPTGYILILTETGKPAATDMGIAAQTIQLAATAMGYAACMLGNVDRGIIHKALGLPANLEIQLTIALGRPGEKIILESMPADGNHTYWRSGDQAHHVPKRSLDEVLVH